MSADESLKESGNALHQRMLAGDVTAPAEIAELFLPLITKRLQRRYPHLDDPHMIDTAVEDALVGYFNCPQRYDPAKSELASYLRMSADGDLRNALKTQKKNIKIVSIDQVVELEDTVTEYQVADDLDLEALIMKNMSPVWQRLDELVPDRVDQEVVLLMMEGVRETQIFAEVLGISVLSPEKWPSEVKRHKDRLKKTLQRAMKPAELKENE